MKKDLSNPFEVISNPELEKKQQDEITDLTVKLQDQRYPEPKKILRGVHPKSHGCVKATFEINKEIDKSLQVGLFSEPGKKYKAWIRFSNASVLVEADLKNSENGSRGMAIKVMDVDGHEKFLLKGNKDRNQDFLMINTPSFAFANVEDYLRLDQVIHANNDDPTNFFAPLNPQVPGFTDEQRARTLKTFQVVQEIKSKPVANPLDVQYFGAAPFLFGPDRVMRFSVDPCNGEQTQILPEVITDNYLREALNARMQESNDICFDFKVQVRGKDDQGLDIEDATAVWDETETPYVTVARITISSPQKVDDPKNVEACIDRVFNPWNALESHQPLGSINRLRKDVYLASAEHRGCPVMEHGKSDDRERSHRKDRDDRERSHKKERDDRDRAHKRNRDDK